MHKPGNRLLVSLLVLHHPSLDLVRIEWVQLLPGMEMEEVGSGAPRVIGTKGKEK
jgi:hypothetical protein